MEEEDLYPPPGSSAVALPLAGIAVGPNAQPGDRERLIDGIDGLMRSMDKKEERTLSRSEVFVHQFKEADYYKGEFATWLKNSQKKYPEYPFLIPLSSDRFVDWKRDKIQFDIFDGFGAPGHSSVHAGLKLVYTAGDEALAEEKELFAGLLIDLSAGGKDMVISGEDNWIVQKLTVFRGINSSDGWNYILSALMTFDQLFEAIKASLENSEVYKNHFL